MQNCQHQNNFNQVKSNQQGSFFSKQPLVQNSLYGPQNPFQNQPFSNAQMQQYYSNEPAYFSNQPFPQYSNVPQPYFNTFLPQPFFNRQEQYSGWSDFKNANSAPKENPPPKDVRKVSPSITLIIPVDCQDDVTSQKAMKKEPPSITSKIETNKTKTSRLSASDGKLTTEKSISVSSGNKSITQKGIDSSPVQKPLNKRHLSHSSNKEVEEKKRRLDSFQDCKKSQEAILMSKENRNAKHKNFEPLSPDRLTISPLSQNSNNEAVKKKCSSSSSPNDCKLTRQESISKTVGKESVNPKASDCSPVNNSVNKIALPCTSINKPGSLSNDNKTPPKDKRTSKDKRSVDSKTADSPPLQITIKEEPLSPNPNVSKENPLLQVLSCPAKVKKCPSSSFPKGQLMLEPISKSQSNKDCPPKNCVNKMVLPHSSSNEIENCQSGSLSNDPKNQKVCTLASIDNKKVNQKKSGSSQQEDPLPQDSNIEAVKKKLSYSSPKDCKLTRQEPTLNSLGNNNENLEVPGCSHFQKSSKMKEVSLPGSSKNVKGKKNRSRSLPSACKNRQKSILTSHDNENVVNLVEIDSSSVEDINEKSLPEISSCEDVLQDFTTDSSKTQEEASHCSSCEKLNASPNIKGLPKSSSADTSLEGNSSLDDTIMIVDSPRGSSLDDEAQTCNDVISRSVAELSQKKKVDEENEVEIIEDSLPKPESSFGSKGPTNDESNKAKKKKPKNVPRCYLLHESKKKLQVAVLYENSIEAILPEHAQHIRTSMLKFLRESIKNETKLRFENICHVDSGWFVLTCANGPTVKWSLNQKIPGCDGRKFRMVCGSDLPKPVTLEINLPRENMETKYVLLALDHQNPGLRTDLWDVLGSRKGQPQKNVKTIVVVAPPTATPLLNSLSWRPYFELSRILIIQRHTILLS